MNDCNPRESYQDVRSQIDRLAETIDCQKALIERQEAMLEQFLQRDRERSA